MFFKKLETIYFFKAVNQLYLIYCLLNFLMNIRILQSDKIIAVLSAYKLESKLEKRDYSLTYSIKEIIKDQDKILVGLKLLFFHC